MSTSISCPRTRMRNRSPPIRRQPRVEPHLAVEVAQAAEAGDEREPCAAAGCDVDAVGRVPVGVGQVHGARVEEVAERGLGVADGGGHDALDARRERRVPGRQRVVVVERPPGLVLAEDAVDEVGGEHDVSLLDHLTAVELERMAVAQQRIVLGGRGGEVPGLAVEEVVVLEDDPELFVARDVHQLGGARHASTSSSPGRWRAPAARGRQRPGRSATRPRGRRPRGSRAPSGSCRRCCRRPWCTRPGRSRR